MKTRSVIFLLIVSICTVITIQASGIGNPVKDFFRYHLSTRQEKLYLHLDKPCYAAGDTIWYKGYLVNAAIHSFIVKSNYIYVELLNRKDSLIQRKMIQRKELSFQNNLALPAGLPAGDYYIRAYTNWMRNFEQDLFFSKNIHIGNSIVEGAKDKITWFPQEDGSLKGKLQLKIPGKDMEGLKISYIVFDGAGKAGLSGSGKCNLNGEMDIQIPIGKYNSKRHLVIKTEDKSVTYENSYYLPSATADYSVTFFPEGGELLAGVTQKIAFKAQQENGFSETVKGFILNQKNDTLTAFSTGHDGMGVAEVTLHSGDKLQAVATSSGGKIKIFDLPEVKDNNFALSVSRIGNIIHYQVKSASSAHWPDSLYVLAHCRGRLMTQRLVTKTNPSDTLSVKAYPDGISHLVLYTKEGIALSNRLFFVRNESGEQWQVTTNKVFAPRGKMKINVKLLDAAGAPMSGEFSVSVTDNRSIVPDTLSDHIVSNLLMTSDLKGFIENPAWYFRSNNEKTARALDLVMMTHGWCRFKVDSLLQKPSLSLPYMVEGGQYLSGRVTGRSKSEKNNLISAYSKDFNIMGTGKVGDDGRFMINNISYPDSVQFAIKLLSKNKKAIEIKMDKPTYPLAYNKNLYNPVQTDMKDYLDKIRSEYYTLNGMRVYNLKEVVVTQKSSTNVYFKNVPFEASYSSEQMNKEFDFDILQTALDVVNDLIVNRYPFKFQNGPSDGSPEEAALGATESISYTSVGNLKSNYWGELNTAVVNNDIFQGRYHVISVLERIDSRSIERMEFIHHEYNFHVKDPNDPQNWSAAVVITLKPGASLMQEPKDPRVTRCAPLGYAWRTEFYQPVYDTPEKKNASAPDLHTTIYWNPSVQMDKDGKASFDVYNSDTPGNYNIVIEGITYDGKACRYSRKL